MPNASSPTETDFGYRIECRSNPVDDSSAQELAEILSYVAACAVVLAGAFALGYAFAAATL